MIKQWIGFAVLLAIGSLGQQSARALVITPVSGSTSSPIIYGTSISNVIDGVINYDSYLSLGTEGYGTFSQRSVQFNLGGTYNLTALNLWNNAGSVVADVLRDLLPRRIASAVARVALAHVRHRNAARVAERVSVGERNLPRP